MDGKAMLVPVTLMEVSMKAAATVARAHHVRRATGSSPGRAGSLVAVVTTVLAPSASLHRSVPAARHAGASLVGRLGSVGPTAPVRATLIVPLLFGRRTN